MVEGSSVEVSDVRLRVEVSDIRLRLRRKSREFGGLDTPLPRLLLPQRPTWRCEPDAVGSASFLRQAHFKL